MSGPLMSSRRFAPLFWCQFFSAFNDNFIKNSLVVLVLFGIGTTAPTENGASLATLATAMLAMPPLLFSGLAGQLADRFDKAIVARRIKLLEIAIALLAGLGFYLHSVPVL